MTFHFPIHAADVGVRASLRLVPVSGDDESLDAGRGGGARRPLRRPRPAEPTEAKGLGPIVEVAATRALIAASQVRGGGNDPGSGAPRRSASSLRPVGLGRLWPRAADRDPADSRNHAAVTAATCSREALRRLLEPGSSSTSTTRTAPSAGRKTGSFARFLVVAFDLLIAL
jgi:hypothetical protein